MLYKACSDEIQGNVNEGNILAATISETPIPGTKDGREL